MIFIFSLALSAISKEYSFIYYFYHFIDTVNFSAIKEYNINRYTFLAILIYLQFQFFYLMIADENKLKKYFRFLLK